MQQYSYLTKLSNSCRKPIFPNIIEFVTHLRIILFFAAVY